VKARSGALAEVASQAEKAGGFVWVGLHDPASSMVDEVATTFGFHPLAVEDAIVASQRPKVERYGDWLFVVLRTARYLDEPEEIDFGEIQLFCAETAVVVIRRGTPVPLAGVRRRLESDPGALAAGPGRVLHAVIDEVVDTYQDCLTGLDDDVSEVELEVFAPVQAAGSVASQLVARIYFLQREILELHRALHPLLAAMPELRNDRLLRADSGQDPYYRDVHESKRKTSPDREAARSSNGAMPSSPRNARARASCSAVRGPRQNSYQATALMPRSTPTASTRASNRLRSGDAAAQAWTSTSLSM
jgi:magnesium transporter